MVKEELPEGEVMDEDKTLVISKDLLFENITKCIMQGRGTEALELVKLARICGVEVLFK